ncbi:MAG TPA: NAD(P)/FAD-dependent oxidoreductase [Caulobacteraceae bacterium]|jgi:thioredoxin reductase|nr:NAD(P)/FAD-dependent oxidoreductase [Caulobacteraceae bacterium]
MARLTDPSAIDGKLAPPEEHAQVLVIGAGPAGAAAAIEAAKRGAGVVLIDENPLDPQLMGLDVPLLYGGRMSGAVQRRGRLVEQLLAANPALEEAIELGVDLRLGVTAWGLYVNGPALRALPAPMVGLADEDRSWMCGFDRLILATGARDVALAFPGWDQPGVVGAGGLQALTHRYDAFTGHRIVVLGAGDLGVATALMAQERGLEIAAVVEVLPQPQASAGAVAQLRPAGIPVLAGHRPRRAEGGRDGVERLVLSDTRGSETVIDCDTVCLAVGMAPAIELLNSAGGRIVPDSRRGGHAPALRGWATSLPGVFVAGDCAGLAANAAEAARQGRQAAAQALGGKAEGHPPTGPDAWAYQAAWFEALSRDADPATIVCQCEAVSRGDLLEVRAPRYLGEPTVLALGRDIASLKADGPLNQDQLKRLTRAGMGPCQGRRCREQIALILAQASGASPADIPLALHRAPVRPLPLKVMADWNETAEMTAGWEIWFAIPGQWSAYEDIGTEREFVTPFGGAA